ncbi:Rhamnan synthesis protein F [Phyllobacterium sp. YR620]|uniref:rhamnosyltransferase WsaF family glycosyltransferase n=1 Tax=Phyllobacterium sp. YR620 TaxID=1881066 RepID=UPI00088FF27F|nr:rhamnan synthesis F family protein [Phyllobacterium sp. YR620]SDP78204.1 Rhamnan synthesis protein F [Phyllobacterium sp. YR620]
MVLKTAKKAAIILKTKGARGFLAQFLRYLASHIENARNPLTWLFPNVMSSSGTKLGNIGALDQIGAVIARPITDETNPVTHVGQGQIPSRIIFDKVAVVVHIFYPEVAENIFQHLKNIPVPFGLFVTTDTEDKRRSLDRAISASGLHPIEVEIRVVPNRGRDVAPKYIAFKDVYERYPAFIHLHSKQSLHAAGAYATWRDYLLGNLIGSKAIATDNLTLLSSENVGAVYPEHADFIKNVINWGYDFPIAKELVAKIGLKLDVYGTLEFPSGSMYWGRSDAIRPLLDLNLDYADFPEEAGQIDGTLAHAIERTLLLFIEKSGHTWKRITAEEPKSSRVDRDERGFSPLISSESQFPGITQVTHRETLRLTVTPTCEERERLNLLVPTISPAHIFGGIDTALKIFLEIAGAAPNSDIRVIVTESQVDRDGDDFVLPEVLKSFDVQKLGHEKRGHRVVVDATDRLYEPLELSERDIFVATAWWTAVNAYRLQDFQKAFFGNAARVIYIIQDFEPGFYGWSTKYALADATYRRDDDTVAIFNSEELATYMEKYYHHQKKAVIPYRPNAKIDASLNSDAVREKIILFYSRPSAVRNCFEAGIDGLHLWRRRNPTQAAAWKIYCIGEAFEKHRAGHLYNITITGKMPLADYADLLSRASVGLSLMISPHPSYPPLEMAYAGIRTITNSYECKNLSERSDLIISIDSVTPEEIAEAIEAQVNIAEQQMVGRQSAIKNPIRDLKTGIPHFEALDVMAMVNKPAPSIERLRHSDLSVEFGLVDTPPRR